ncbi:hypothetical protein TNIN_410491 [Trichonephila inaurata madagascariensis]|uniref:Uncharacterized protein n=1 Tax=Trichonephila inaurata madagascariensis TaxID=2747483 RepID=A0A8X6MJV9_9ARAC|nr:hypothetical protein TNIN_410491 [Trichonephila inaurata madagascariensis]
MGVFLGEYEESSLVWYRGSQNHSPLVEAFLGRLGIRSRRAGIRNQFRHVHGPVLGGDSFLLFITNNSQPPNINFHRGELFVRCGSSTIDAVDRGDSRESPCPFRPCAISSRVPKE